MNPELLRIQQEKVRIAEGKQLREREKQFLQRVYDVAKNDQKIGELVCNPAFGGIHSHVYDRARQILCDIAKEGSRDSVERKFAESLYESTENQTNLIDRIGIEIQKVAKAQLAEEPQYRGPSL